MLNFLFLLFSSILLTIPPIYQVVQCVIDTKIMYSTEKNVNKLFVNPHMTQQILSIIVYTFFSFRTKQTKKQKKMTRKFC